MKKVEERKKKLDSLEESVEVKHTKSAKKDKKHD